MNTEEKNIEEKKICVGISHGDFNSISYEIILKTFQDARMFDFCTPILYGSNNIANFYKNTIPSINYNLNIINTVNQAVENKLNIININTNEIKVTVGESTKDAGALAFESLEAVTQDIGHGIDVIVTGPINKENIQSEEFKFPGHTEYLANKFGKDKELMILASKNIKIAIVTGHIPLSKVSETITKELILKKLTIFEQSLKIDFGITKPKIAVLSINPHASDNGLMGNEETDIIIPAIETAQNNKMLAFGPFAADGFFGSNDFNKFDGVLAMYHDQGLIPFKIYSFEDGVNYTAGLDIIRTSPDHGTAYNIAGKDIANHGSFREAILLATDIYKKRTEWKEISKNPLDFSSFENVKDASITDLTDN